MNHHTVLFDEMDGAAPLGWYRGFPTMLEYRPAYWVLQNWQLRVAGPRGRRVRHFVARFASWPASVAALHYQPDPSNSQYPRPSLPAAVDVGGTPQAAVRSDTHLVEVVAGHIGEDADGDADEIGEKVDGKADEKDIRQQHHRCRVAHSLPLLKLWHAKRPRPLCWVPDRHTAQSEHYAIRQTDQTNVRELFLNSETEDPNLQRRGLLPQPVAE